MLYRIFVAFCLCISFSWAETLNTFYGSIEVEEPVLLELIHSPAMQRLKHIHQYGVAYYTTHKEEYNRYDHSIGVFALLRKNGASLEEQISGLLHDVSHTVFSHVGDWVFGKEYQEDDYQSLIFKIYLANSGIEDILIKYGYTINQVPPKGKGFSMLEQSLPNLCADRIDYNIQGAYFQNFLTKEEAIELYNDFQYIDGIWITSRIDLLKKITDYSLFMTEDCWGAAVNYTTSRWLADSIIRGLDVGLLSWKEIHYGIDHEVWNKLSQSKDPVIQHKMHQLANIHQYFKWSTPQEATHIVKFRCRGIDPWILQEGKLVRLTTTDAELAQKFKILKQKAENGWAIQILN
jgi:uncharacterized protein